MITIEYKGMFYTFMGVAYASNVPDGIQTKKVVVYCSTGKILWLPAKECKVVIEKDK